MDYLIKETKSLHAVCGVHLKDETERVNEEQPQYTFYNTKQLSLTVTNNLSLTDTFMRLIYLLDQIIPLSTPIN